MKLTKKISILHVNDQAAVSGILAKYQRLLGHNVVEVVVRYGYDGLGQKLFYGDHFVGPKRRRFKKFGFFQKPLRLISRTVSVIYFYFYVMVHARLFDVVHIHSQYLVSLWLPFKPKIIEFHGDDIRSTPTVRWWIDRAVTSCYLWLMKNKVFYVSTPDMVEYLRNAVYIPNPIDTEFFTRRKKAVPNSAVYFHNWHETGYARAQQLASKNHWDLEIVDRTIKNRPIRYKDMAEFLESKEFLIDRCAIKSLSKTALEALAMGLTVVDFNDCFVKGLPAQHDPLLVAATTIRIYEKEINKR